MHSNHKLVEFDIQHGLVEKGDLVVTTAGVPLGISATTNLLRVATIGHPV